MIEFEFLCEADETLHISKHQVTPEEIDEAFNDHEYLWYKRPDDSYVAFSKLSSGRYLKIVFRETSPKIYFIITAYDLTDFDIIGKLDSEEIL